MNCCLLLIFLSVCLFISTVHGERARNDDLQDGESSSYIDDDRNSIETVKRFLFKKKTTTKTPKPNYHAISALVTTPRHRGVSTSTSRYYDKYGYRGGSSPYSGHRYTSAPVKGQCGFTNPCKNGGTCRTLTSGRRFCLCKKEFYGNHCEKRFHSSDYGSSDRSRTDHCASYPCRNGGKCVSLRTTFYCRCKLPYYGITCSKRLSKREEIADELNSSELYERDLEEDLQSAIDSEDMTKSIE